MVPRPNIVVYRLDMFLNNAVSVKLLMNQLNGSLVRALVNSVEVKDQECTLKFNTYLDEEDQNIVDRVVKEHTGLPMPDNKPITTGFALLDRAIGGGLQRYSTFLITAPAGEGKTNIAINMAVSQAKDGLRVVYICTEESYQQIYKRIAASVSGVPLSVMEEPTPEMKRKIKLSMRKVQQSSLRVTGVDTGDINEILEAMLVVPGGLDVLVLDGLTALYSEEYTESINRKPLSAVRAARLAAASGNIAIVATLTEKRVGEPIPLQVVETVDYWMRLKRNPDVLTRHSVKIEKNRYGSNGAEFLAYIDGARCRTALNTGRYGAWRNQAVGENQG